MSVLYRKFNIKLCLADRNFFNFKLDSVLFRFRLSGIKNIQLVEAIVLTLCNHYTNVILAQQYHVYWYLRHKCIKEERPRQNDYRKMSYIIPTDKWSYK